MSESTAERAEGDSDQTAAGITCRRCDGLGEWDEGPINTHSGWCQPADPEYRRVICPECKGTGRLAPMVGEPAHNPRIAR